MKQETKELIKWIKDRLEHIKWENSFAKNEGKDIPDFDDDYDKAITFLDSLEEFENQLKHGGYIPDIHGNPCKVGDKVRWLGDTNEYATNGHGRVHGEIYTLGYTNFSWEIQDSEGFVECVMDKSEIEKVSEQ